VNADDFLFLDSGHYNNISSLTGTVLFRFASPVYFATLAVFKQKLFASSVSLSELKIQDQSLIQANKLNEVCVFLGIADQTDLLETDCGGSTKATDGGNAKKNMKLKKQVVDLPLRENNCESVTMPEPVNGEDCSKTSNMKPDKPDDVRNIIVECNAIPFVDTAGCMMLAQLHAAYGIRGIRFVLAGCCDDVVSSLKKVEQCETLCKDALYPSIHSAVLCLHR